MKNDLPQSEHISVMLKEVLEALNVTEDGIYLDGTFGAGGYTRAILSQCDCAVWAIDRDPTVKKFVDELKGEYPDRFNFLSGCFADMEYLLKEKGILRVNGIVLDIGVSSMQLDQAERGFSFMQDGPLCMRMGNEGPTAADIVNNLDEDDLENIIFKFGDERASRRIAKAIVARRKELPFTRTLELADVVEKAVGKPKYIKGKKQKHGATKTFQALRIYVNSELEQLQEALSAAERILQPGGRLCIVSFHSTEDKIVKEFFKVRSGDVPQGSRHLPVSMDEKPEPTFKLTMRNGKKATKEETDRNIRSRSARLRAAIRTDAPAWDKEKAA